MNEYDKKCGNTVIDDIKAPNGWSGQWCCISMHFTLCQLPFIERNGQNDCENIGIATGRIKSDHKVKFVLSKGCKVIMQYEVMTEYLIKALMTYRNRRWELPAIQVTIHKSHSVV